MAQGFFAIRDHRDMLAKAERELARMRDDLGTDAVFNFFVTAYHVMDYVKALGLPRAATDAMYADPDFDLCQFICNKGKHLQLRAGDRDATHTEGVSGMLDMHGFDVLGFDEDIPPGFFVDGTRVDVLRLGRDLVAKWEAFFVVNGI